MGDFANISDSIVEELLKIVPISYFLTEDFKKMCAENGFSGRWSMCSTMVTFKGTNILIPTTERIDLVLEKVCHELSENSNRALYNFISLVIKSYCDYENTKVDLSDLRILFRAMGVVKIPELEQYDSNTPFTHDIVVEINKWDEMKDIVAKLEIDCTKATDTDAYRNIGNTCRNLLIQLAQLVYDANLHGKYTEKGKEIGKTDVYEMLAHYLSFKLQGKGYEEYRAYAKAALKLASMLTHKTPAKRKDMLLTASATINLVYAVGLIDDKFIGNSFV